jgi:hypothetical protein
MRLHSWYHDRIPVFIEFIIAVRCFPDELMGPNLSSILTVKNPTRVSHPFSNFSTCSQIFASIGTFARVDTCGVATGS